MNTRTKGRESEQLVVRYLKSCRYRILEINYQTNFGEIDCIAEDRNGELVFIEVKSVSFFDHIDPILKVNRKKQKTIIKVAKYYLVYKSSLHQACRFDVITVVNEKIEHFRNAFYV